MQLGCDVLKIDILKYGYDSSHQLRFEQCQDLGDQLRCLFACPGALQHIRIVDKAEPMVRIEYWRILAGIEQALKLSEAMPVAALPGFSEGRVSVQDAAAQIAAPWLLKDHKGSILDACAAPGGKSAHLLELGGEIALTSVDRDVERLESVAENLKRLGLTATVLAGDASNPSEWWNGEPFDGILLDAPCSASGVIRRHPDIKLLRRESDIAELARLQSALLAALWPLLKPNGRLLYVTCSVLAAENDAVVARFLDSTADARENDMLPNNNIRDVMRARDRGYQVLPGTAGLDGFYFACLEKVS